MQTSIKPEKMKRKFSFQLDDKERAEHELRQLHKRKHHKTKRGSRNEWEGSY